MALHVEPGLIVVVVFLILFIIGSLFYATRKGWMHWERVSHFSLVIPYAGSPTLLMIYRTIIFLFSLGVLLHVVFVKADAYTYYTIWNFTMLTVYFGLASGCSINAYRQGFVVSAETSHSKFHRTIYVLMEIVSTMVFLVDITLWGVLYPDAIKAAHDPDDDMTMEDVKHEFLSFNSFVVHMSNLFFIMIDFSVNQIHLVPAHSLFLLPWAIAFALVSWIYKSAGGKWVYPFLDTTAKAGWAWYLGLAAAHILLYFLVFGLSKLKQMVFRDQYEQLAKNGDIQDESTPLRAPNDEA